MTPNGIKLTNLVRKTLKTRRNYTSLEIQVNYRNGVGYSLIIRESHSVEKEYEGTIHFYSWKDFIGNLKLEYDVQSMDYGFIFRNGYLDPQILPTGAYLARIPIYSEAHYLDIHIHIPSSQLDSLK